MSKIAHYAPSKIEASILGIPLEGYSKESFITIKRTDPIFTFRRAPDGSVNAFLNKHAGYEIEFSLRRTSPSNTWLHLLLKLFNSYGIPFLMPVMVNDKLGGTSFFATECFFDEEPSTTFSSTVEDNKWKIICHNGSYSLGGNVEGTELGETISALAQVVEISTWFGVDLSGFQGAIEAVAQKGFESLGALKNLL